MANTYFSFKQFTVHQDKCAMKVGTDGVLLGAWSDVEHAENILDVGTGTGLVAIMLAQRSTACITAIEIDKDAVGQAMENVALTPWENRIRVLQADFREFKPGKKFDVIVSNPPYFVDSLPSPDDKRNNARHNSELTYEELIRHSSRLLSPSGKFIVIVPIDVSEKVKSAAHSARLFPVKQLNIVTVPGKSPKRCLLEFGLSSQPCSITSLLIEGKRHVYSEGFKSLLKDYYLNM